MDPSTSLHRGFSDTLAFTPHGPSRLGPGKRRAEYARGTVSMPTSPLLGTKEVDPIWAEQPQSAQAFFGVPQENYDLHTASNWCPPLPQDHYATSSSGSLPLSMEDLDGSMPPQSDAGRDGERKKRAQVRIACIHCQKACKKCSNTRPCERCVKYGLKDCVNSTRKPRKTGIKRGPYKRRSSSKFHPNGFFPDSPPSYKPSGQHRPSYGQTNQGYTDHPYYTNHKPPSPPREQTSYGPTNNHTNQHQSAPPGPQTAALHGAFASALAGPRWVHGQRTIGMGGNQGGDPLYPPTPTVPFPISLNHRNTDPFSRAVSPIHGDLDQALAGLKPRVPSTGQIAMDHAMSLGLNVNMDMNLFPGPNGTEMANDQNTQGQLLLQSAQPGNKSTNLFTDPFAGSNNNQHLPANMQNIHAFSAPTSPRQNWSPSVVRANSAECEHPPNPFENPPHPLSMTPESGGSLQSPAIIALKKIRKPSLRTLMSHGGSQASSRAVSPIPESPTLFNQPMALDEGGMDAMTMNNRSGNVSANSREWDMTKDAGKIRLDGEAGNALVFGFDTAIPFQT